MNAIPSTPNAAPTSSYGQRVASVCSGTSRPIPMPTASEVSPVRHHARYVRSFASRVRRVASSTPGSLDRRAYAGCEASRELAELAGHEVGDLLADVDGVVADPLDAAGDDEHPQAVLALLRRVAEREHVLDRVAVRAVDQLVELDERLRLLGVARRRTSPCATRIICSARWPMSSIELRDRARR